MSRESDIDRRSVVKALGAGASLAVGLGAGGAAAATDGDADAFPEDCTDCFVQTRCNTGLLCSTPTEEFPYQVQQRQCCTCTGEVLCTNWRNVENSCCSG